MSDRIELRGLRVLGRHGAREGEQDAAQPFEVDLEVEAELGEAAHDDDLTKTVDYSLVVETAMAIVGERQYRLLEALAGAIATGVLEIPGVQAVTVTVRKLRPPVAADMASAGVRLRRERGDRSG
jgi:dihydroneopterin aldolase